MKEFIDRWFWTILILAIVLGLFLPGLGQPLIPYLRLILGGILFFSALRLEFTAALKELRKPALGLYATFLMMIVAPLGLYVLASVALPRSFAVGVLILAAMPSGMACSALSDIVGGNAALALVITLLTYVVCPFTAPWVIEL
ncbi:MAG: bile acid:sodium symporter, partial [Kiritimatiellia bacterium]